MRISKNVVVTREDQAAHDEFYSFIFALRCDRKKHISTVTAIQTLRETSVAACIIPPVLSPAAKRPKNVRSLLSAPALFTLVDSSIYAVLSMCVLISVKSSSSSGNLRSSIKLYAAWNT